MNVMIFRKGGRRGGVKYMYKGNELKAINKYKYLGFWFSTGNEGELDKGDRG